MKFDEECGDGYCDGRKEKRESLWQRVKWTEQMVKLLINVVSYVEEGASSDCMGGVRRKQFMLQRIGKWKCVSKVMVKRGYHVSPQQCEDKFNDLNKRYKRCNDFLGRGTSCKVAENSELLDTKCLSDKAKEEVKKILSSKNLFNEEMCSYHKGNRLHLPHDPEVQRSSHLLLRCRDNKEPNQSRQNKSDDDCDKGQQGAGADDQIEETEDNGGTPRFSELSLKSKSDGLQEQWMAFRLLQLKEQKLYIQVQKLELEKQRSKWQRVNWYNNRNLDKMRPENQCMKFENKCLAFELKRKKISSV
ncbi:hypothetical protein SCA6_006009 [Theobroma cacao]